MHCRIRSVGRETAKRFSAFGAEIIAVNRSKIEDQVVNRWIPLKKIDEILPEVDIIILCIALTGETMNLINSVRLDKMKDGSVLVNISRGNIIERKALRKFLKKRNLEVLHWTYLMKSRFQKIVTYGKPPKF